jgi:type I restriction enzyme, S subunit
MIGVRIISLGEIARFRYGKMPEPEKILAENATGGFPIFTGYRIAGRYSEFNIETPKLIVVCRGVGGTGDVKITPDKCWLTNLSIYFELTEEFADIHYLYYFFAAYSLRFLDTGSAQSQITIADLQRLKMPLPSLITQKKIAAILSAYDELIENNRRRIALLEKMAEELYREWFVRMRFPGHDKVKKVKGVPECWREMASSDVFDVLSGGTPKTDIPVYWDGEIPFFTPKDATENYYVLRTEQNITEKGLEACNSRLYPKDTIFITARGTVGKLALANRPMAMNQSCYALAPKAKGMVYFHFLAIRNALTYIKGVSKSGVFDNIIVDTFKTVPLLIPQPELVDRFDNTIAPFFLQTSALLEANEILASKRDKLLPRLISGKLSVENLDIHFPPGMEEPAHEH